MSKHKPAPKLVPLSSTEEMAVCSALIFVAFIFFFQAEDGIRYHCVTGVQTCASSDLFRFRKTRALRDRARRRTWATSATARKRNRSEERRVGKECRSRWSPYH